MLSVLRILLILDKQANSNRQLLVLGLARFLAFLCLPTQVSRRDEQRNLGLNEIGLFSHLEGAKKNEIAVDKLECCGMERLKFCVLACVCG